MQRTSMLQRSGTSSAIVGSSKAVWKLNVQGASGHVASARLPSERARPPAESHCLISSASSQVSAGKAIPAMIVGVFRQVVLADPIAVEDLEDHEIVRMHAGGIAEPERLGRHRLRGDVPPEVDDREAAFPQSARHVRLAEERLALGQQGAIGVVARRRLRQVAQAPRSAGQRVVAVHHVDRRLHLLPAADTAPAPVAGDRADVVIEGRDQSGAGLLPNVGGAVRVVTAHDLIVVEKVDIRTTDGTLDQLEAIGVEREALRPLPAAPVMDRHLPLLQIGAFPGAVIAVAVPAHEHLAVTVERALYRGRQVGERAGTNRVGLCSCRQVHRTMSCGRMGRPIAYTERTVVLPAKRAPLALRSIARRWSRTRPARCNRPPRPGEECRGCGRRRPRCPSTRLSCG